MQRERHKKNSGNDMMHHILTGFGFGPIQAGLFVKEAFASNNFDRIVIAEIDQRLVEALRQEGGEYHVNVAQKKGIEVKKIENIELLNPDSSADRKRMVEAISGSTEIVTALPSVDFYDAGGSSSVAGLIAEGFEKSRVDTTIVYAAENHNQAAEILAELVRKTIGVIENRQVQFLNTVIGKMSRVVTDQEEMEKLGLAPICSGINRAFLVEQFNRILVSRCTLQKFRPGISVFVEKDQLLPFEEAKLYGHNAIHSLLGYLGMMKEYEKMTEVGTDPALMNIARSAFLNESGAALIKKYKNLGEELFTEDGYRHYCDDLLERMINAWLNDTPQRAVRDPVRKLGLKDRIFGTMALALEFGIEPNNMAVGAAAGLRHLLENPSEYNLPEELRFDAHKNLEREQIEEQLRWLWQGQFGRFGADIVELVYKAQEKIKEIVGV